MVEFSQLVSRCEFRRMVPLPFAGHYACFARHPSCSLLGMPQDTVLRVVAMLAVAAAAANCAGGSGAAMTPASPGSTAAVTVAIVATSGNRSYVPNPVQTAGQPLIFKNNDSATHHIVMDDGSADFGSLAPGASSAARSIAGAGNFHCTIHPSMVGNINGAVAPDPAPGSGDGY